jgi:hypothetical protein
MWGDVGSLAPYGAPTSLSMPQTLDVLDNLLCLGAKDKYHEF